LLDRVLNQLGNRTRACLLLLSYVVLLAAGLFGPVAVFAVAALCVLLMEWYVAGWSSAANALLDKLGISLVYRHLARDLAVVLLLVRALELSNSQITTVVVLPATVYAAAVATGVLVVVIDRLHPLPALIRNIDLDPHAVPPRPPSWIVRLAGDRLTYVNVLMIPGALASVALGDLTPFVVSGVIALAAATLMTVVLAVGLMRGRNVPSRSSVLSAIQTWLKVHRPQIMIYLAGPEKDVYQVNMWLGPVEALDQPALVVLRSLQAFHGLARTRLPVVCIPRAVDLMNVDFDGVRAVLYPANGGPNIHMLREPGMKHVFIGHGDSDKQASVNPYTKVYDEVWVAGPAGRERYARAAVGVLDRNIVEIGRPQLAAVEAFALPVTDRPFTVLYAPTWEGWVDDPYHCSLVLMGESIVGKLLELAPALRVLYKPHPLTGTRSKNARAVHGRLVGLIREAGGRTDATSTVGSSHLVVRGPTPGLFACFNASDLLISDVSSVVADFVQSQRPYVVANPSGLPEDEFRRNYPTARAAYLLSPDAGELEKIVDLTRAGDDPMREARRELKSYLLGPDEPDSLERFRTEVARLCG
jgi:hypothetical protein